VNSNVKRKPGRWSRLSRLRIIHPLRVIVKYKQPNYEKKNGSLLIHPTLEILLVMKTMFLFFLLTTFTAFSEISYSQVTRISLNLQNVPVKEVLKTIEDQTEFIFFYQDQEIDLNRIVSITVINLPVNEILDRILPVLRIFIQYVTDRLSKLDKNKLAGEAGSIRPIFSQSRQGHAVTGKVTDRPVVKLCQCKHCG
jgi:hypothetical protein